MSKHKKSLDMRNTYTKASDAVQKIYTGNGDTVSHQQTLADTEIFFVICQKMHKNTISFTHYSDRKVTSPQS